MSEDYDTSGSEVISQTPQERKLALHEEALRAIVHPDHIVANKQIYAQLRNQLAQGTIDLDAAEKQHEELLIQVSSTDSLTGLDNYKSAHFKLGQMIDYCRAEGLPLIGIYIDGDDFGVVNEKGHDVGNIAIIDIATASKRGIRPTDLLVRLHSEEEASQLPSVENPVTHQVSRLGGDEFFIAVPGANLDDGRRLFSRVQRNLGNLTSGSLGTKLKVTGGAVLYDLGGNERPEDFIARADWAMQFGKENNKGTLNISALPTFPPSPK